jgi:glycolate oxidase iron-sulfur subunit
MSAPAVDSPGPGATPDPAADVRRGIFDAKLLDACISCGFCLPVCPTYAMTKDERSSPRGRITLMRALEEGRLDADDPTLQEQASFCLGCRACETVCPAGVQYGHLLEQWRDHQWRGRHAPPLALGLRAAMRVTPALAIAGRVRGAARTTGAARSEVAAHLMLGCAERSLFPNVSKAVLTLLPGVVDVPAGQGCCGAMHAHNGDSAGAVDLARTLGRRLPGTILVTAGGCGAHLANVLGRDRVRELSEFLLERWGQHPQEVPPLRRLGVRAALQDSCHLRNGMKVTLPPRDLVARVADYVELASAGRCCGAAGTYSMLRREDSQKVLDVHLDEIEAAGLDYLVVVNVVCQRQMVNGLRRRKSRTKVVHLAELLAMAL